MTPSQSHTHPTREPFLKQVAQQLYHQYGKAMHRLAVVFPNRRQAVFFRHYLQQLAQPPCFVPELLTIEELVEKTAGLPLAGPLHQYFALYEAYRAVCIDYGQQAETLPAADGFYGTGDVLLRDFREIDAGLANIQEVCRILFDIESIDKTFEHLTDEQRDFLKTFWQGLRERSKMQEKFLRLWELLPKVYERWMELLEKQGFTTLGRAYRLLAASGAADASCAASWDHVAFVGFNALNKAEETFISRWHQTGFASIWMDADAWYVNNPQQEAGYFLRRNLKQLGWKNAMNLLDAIETRKVNLQVVAVPGHQAQAKTISQWWKDIPDKNDTLRLGILLADETLLMPVLQSLPDDMDSVNITTGYSIQHTPVFHLLKLYTEVQNDLSGHDFSTIRHTLILQWLRHPFCDISAEDASRLEQQIIGGDWLRVSAQWLKDWPGAASKLLFTPAGQSEVMLLRLAGLLEGAMALPRVSSDTMLQGVCLSAWKNLRQLAILMQSLDTQPSIELTGKLLLKQMATVSVPFEGEPLQGVQVMGLLESRGIDFDHILLLGAGEGTLPRIKPPDSFLPENVRRAFGLSVPEHQDAVFAYVFYRLLHRAQSITLVHNALVTDNSTGEESRFIRQLEFERYRLPEEAIRRSKISHPVFPESWPAITVPKGKEIMEKLRRYYHPDKPVPVSPSAINSYLACRLQFFFRYIAGQKAPEEMETDISAAALGRVVHKLLELLYEYAIQETGGHITAEMVDRLEKMADEKIPEALRLSWREKPMEAPPALTGALHVAHAMILRFTRYILQCDREMAPFTLHHLEMKFMEPFDITVEGKRERIMLKGYIDRVDSKNGVYRMADYKTSSDNPEFQDIDGLFDRDEKKQNKAALQTLLYAWMFHRKNPDKANFEPALLVVKYLMKNKKDSALAEKMRLYKKEEKAQITHQTIHQDLKEVENKLRDLLEEWMNPDIPFDQTETLKNCQYCDFKGICRR